MPFTRGHKAYGMAIKGAKANKTLDKEAALFEFQQRVMLHMKPITEKLIDMASGKFYMFEKKWNKEKNKKVFTLVTNQDRISELIDYHQEEEGKDWYYICTKTPSVQAFKILMDRTFGKPPKSIEILSNEVAPSRPSTNLDEAIAKVYGNKDNKKAEN